MNCKKCGREVITESTVSTNHVKAICQNPSCEMYLKRNLRKIEKDEAKK
jgi:hypothetical protein